MKKMKPITNPMLVGALELLKAENTPEHRTMVMEEVLHAKFLTPVMIIPEPVQDENGIAKIEPDSKVIPLYLSSPEGKNYVAAYTDMQELQKMNKETVKHIFGYNFGDYVRLVMAENSPVEGVIINPFGHKLVIPKEVIATMIPKNPNA